MRVLVIGINYAPEKTSVGPFTTGLCEYLASEGHDVVVVTAFPYYPEWKVTESYRGSIYRKEMLNGILIHRVAHFVPSRPSNLWQRLAHDLSFTANAFCAGLFSGKCDVIYCVCPPATVGLATWLLGKIKRAPYVVKLTDLASDAALATGIMREGFAIHVARALENHVYKHARAITCLCHAFVEHLVTRGMDPKKLHFIPDWVDTEHMRPLESNHEFLRDYGLSSEKFLIIHSGNMGKKQDLMNIVEAADLSRKQEDLLWLLVGHGEERGKLEQEVIRRGLTNTKLLPLQPVETLAQFLSSAGVFLLNQQAAVTDSVIPSKLLTYMAMGRPVVAAVNDQSEAARYIRIANCGVIVPPGNPGALVEAVLSIRNSPSLREQFGHNARAYALRHFTKAKVLQSYREFFQELQAGKARTRTIGP